MTKQEIVKQEANKLILEHLPSRHWCFTVEQKAPRWKKGQCLAFYQTLLISDWHIEEDPFEDIRQTILHEIAHAKTGSFDFTKPESESDHGPSWRKVAKSLGVDVSRYETPEV